MYQVQFSLDILEMPLKAFETKPVTTKPLNPGTLVTKPYQSFL